jgi:hypothetical protein
MSARATCAATRSARANDDARPILYYNKAANCHYPKVKGLVTQVNSIYNNNRFEGVWLDN